MSDQIAERHSLHIDSIDAYAARMDRMEVLIDWLTKQVVMGEPHAYDAMTVQAVAFLHDEMHDARAEQKAIEAKMQELESAGGER